LVKLLNVFVFRIEQVLAAVKFDINISHRVCSLVFKIFGCDVFKEKFQEGVNVWPASPANDSALKMEVTGFC
jgi:hypothetical protein